MISFTENNCRFHYRAAGVAVRPHDGAILLHRAERDAFWSLPGGRCEMDEAAADALGREMHEEIGVSQTQADRLLWIVENFFTHKNERQHEIGLYFLMTFPKDAWIYEQTVPFAGMEHNDGTGTPLPLIFAWKLPTAANDLPILPRFLETSLAFLPTTPLHIVNRENNAVGSFG